MGNIRRDYTIKATSNGFDWKWFKYWQSEGEKEIRIHSIKYFQLTLRKTLERTPPSIEYTIQKAENSSNPRSRVKTHQILHRPKNIVQNFIFWVLIFGAQPTNCGKLPSTIPKLPFNISFFVCICRAKFITVY